MKKINLVEKLKSVPDGTELYNTIYGTSRLRNVDKLENYPIKTNHGSFSSDGKYSISSNGECCLFPSLTQRNWDLFHYALAGEYVTVISLNRKGKELKYICQIENDGVFDAENSKVSKSNGVIGKNLVEVRAATKEEIEELQPKQEFKKGDVVVIETWIDEHVGIVDILHGKAPVCVKSSISNSTCEFNSVRHATQDEINDWKETLRSEYNAMLKDGEMVPWRAKKGEHYFLVSDYGVVHNMKDCDWGVDNMRYNLHKQGACNYFATENLAKESPIYKTFHP